MKRRVYLSFVLGVLIFMTYPMRGHAQSSFWRGFAQGMANGARQNAAMMQQIRKQQALQAQRQAAQPQVARILQTESNGFQWYKLISGIRFTIYGMGAQNENGQIIIPLERGYQHISFQSETERTGYFCVNKDGKEGICDLSGREIIPPLYESTTYYDDKFKVWQDGSFKETEWSLTENGIAYIPSAEMPQTNNYASTGSGLLIDQSYIEGQYSGSHSSSSLSSSSSSTSSAKGHITQSQYNRQANAAARSAVEAKRNPTASSIGKARADQKLLNTYSKSLKH